MSPSSNGSTVVLIATCVFQTKYYRTSSRCPIPSLLNQSVTHREDALLGFGRTPRLHVCGPASGTLSQKPSLCSSAVAWPSPCSRIRSVVPLLIITVTVYERVGRFAVSVPLHLHRMLEPRTAPNHRQTTTVTSSGQTQANAHIISIG